MLLAIQVPAGNERGPQYLEQALTAVAQGSMGRLPLSLDCVARGEEVLLLCRAPDRLSADVERQLFAHDPDADIRRLPPESLALSPAARTLRCWLQLAPDLFPLKRYPQFEDALNRLLADPLAALLQVLPSPGKQDVSAQIRLILRPARLAHIERARKCLRRLPPALLHAHPHLAVFFLRLYRAPWYLRWPTAMLARLGRRPEATSHPTTTTAPAARTHDREGDTQGAEDKLGRLLFDAQLEIRVWGSRQRQARLEQKLEEILRSFGTFHGRQAHFHPCRRPRRFLLSAEEVATLWHPPTHTVQAPALPAVLHRDRPPPLDLPAPAGHPESTLLGVTHFRSGWKKFGILPEDRFRHLALLGKTGMGKSTLLHRLIVSDIQAGRAAGVLDPHGDLIEQILPAIPARRTNDVVLFDPADVAHPLSFNLFAGTVPQQRPKVASGIVVSFKKVFGEFWGPRMEHYLRNAVLALLDVPGTSLVSLARFLSDARFRQEIVRQVENPAVRNVWEKEFAAKPARDQQEYIAPIQNKLSQFLSYPLLCHIVGQGRNKLDLRAVMDGGHILLCNLSKGKLGEDVSQLLGSFLTTAVQLAAMGRADLLPEQRRDFHFYVDEFQSYATESFAGIFSEARKYRLSLTVAINIWPNSTRERSTRSSATWVRSSASRRAPRMRRSSASNWVEGCCRRT